MCGNCVSFTYRLSGGYEREIKRSERLFDAGGPLFKYDMLTPVLLHGLGVVGVVGCSQRWREVFSDCEVRVDCFSDISTGA